MKNKESKKITPQKFFKIQGKVFRELLSEKGFWTIGIILFSILISICGFIEVKFIEYLTDGIYGFYNGEYNFKNLFFTFLLFFFLLFFAKILKKTYNKISAKYDSYVSFLIDQKITKHISLISYEYFENMEFYDKIYLAAKASAQYPNAVYGITQIFNIVSSLIVYCVILSEINFMFVFLVVISIFLGAAISIKTTDWQLDYWRNKVSPEERKNNYFKNIYSNRINQNNIQIKQAHAFFSQKYHTYNLITRKNYLKLNGMSFATELVVSLLFVISFCFIAITVGDKIAKGVLNLGYYSMVVLALSNLFISIKKFVKYMTNASWYVRVLEAYYEVLSLDSSQSVLAESNSSIAGIIVFKEVSYQYEQAKKYALKNINLSFSSNQKIAIVGANGSGKTTCVMIVLGLLKNYIGNFCTKKILYSAVLQDYGKYQMTIKQNIEIGVGGKELTDSEIEGLLKKVGMYEFVISKPNGIHSMLGQLEQGEELSAGQWQRLAIARLLANEDADVWILDEPTAHLDPIAEIEVYKLIFELSKDKLVIFISHRLGFAKMAENIIVFNDGEIKEIGNHSQLMKKNGLYKKMFDIQKEMYL